MVVDNHVQVLAFREGFRDRYGRQRDPIRAERLLWRAEMFRHIVRFLPGQTILELGAGDGVFTRQLVEVSRGENPITAVVFGNPVTDTTPLANTERIHLRDWPGLLRGRHFDCIVGVDMLDRRVAEWLLRTVDELLTPGGQLILFESNPSNPVLRLRRFSQGRHFDERQLLTHKDALTLLANKGFVGVNVFYNDFVYAPLTRRLIWLLRNLSILLENMPFIQRSAGSLFIYAEKGAVRPKVHRLVSLCEHPRLSRTVSVVVPCHNEEMNVRPLVAALLGLYRDYIREIVLVDDNSRDNTAQTILALAAEDPIIVPVIRTPPNGVGRALFDGFKASTGQYVLSMDCDFAHLLPAFRDLFDAAAEGYDVVIGSRFSRHSVLLNYPFQKIIANRMFHLLARIALRRSFRDLTNNLKLFRREVVRNLQLSEPCFAANAETGLQPLMMGFSVREVPISWVNRTAEMGVSSFSLARVGGGYWRVLARLCIATRLGFRPLVRHHLSAEDSELSPRRQR